MLVGSIEMFAEGLGLAFAVCTVVPVLLFALDELGCFERRQPRSHPSDDTRL